MNTRLFVSALATGLIFLAGASNANAAGLLNFGGGGCGCEVSCCDPCGPKFGHRLKHIFAKKNHCCEEVVSCGCEPSCGVDMGCGCEATPCCSRPPIGYHIRNAFHKCFRPKCGGCDSCGMDMGCGCGEDNVHVGCGTEWLPCHCNHQFLGCGCDNGCGCNLGAKIRGLFKSHRHCGGCDSCGMSADMGCGCN